jgi:phage gp16-like protein
MDTAPPGHNSRKALFAACRQLGLDEDARRALMRDVVGVASTKDLSPQQWGTLMNHMNRLTGYTDRHGKHGPHGRVPNRPTLDRAALLSKIEAQLADMKLPWGYLTSSKYGKSMVRRLAGVDALEFASPDGLHKIVAALAYRQKKQA